MSMHSINNFKFIKLNEHLKKWKSFLMFVNIKDVHYYDNRIPFLSIKYNLNWCTF
jgi:hypothetical protein